jgi:hypothetical protein
MASHPACWRRAGSIVKSSRHMCFAQSRNAGRGRRGGYPQLAIYRSTMMRQSSVSPLPILNVPILVLIPFFFFTVQTVPFEANRSSAFARDKDGCPLVRRRGVDLRAASLHVADVAGIIRAVHNPFHAANLDAKRQRLAAIAHRVLVNSIQISGRRFPEGSVIAVKPVSIPVR